MHDDDPSGVPCGLADGVQIQRGEGPQVNEADIDSFGRERLGRLERSSHHRAVRHDGAIVAVAQRPRLADPRALDGERSLLLGPVAALRLQEDHRIGVVDRESKQPVRVERR